MSQQHLPCCGCAQCSGSPTGAQNQLGQTYLGQLQNAYQNAQVTYSTYAQAQGIQGPTAAQMQGQAMQTQGLMGVPNGVPSGYAPGPPIVYSARYLIYLIAAIDMTDGQIVLYLRYLDEADLDTFYEWCATNRPSITRERVAKVKSLI